jgi:hypothetical protein
MIDWKLHVYLAGVSAEKFEYLVVGAENLNFRNFVNFLCCSLYLHHGLSIKNHKVEHKSLKLCAFEVNFFGWCNLSQYLVGFLLFVILKKGCCFALFT